MDGYGEEGGGDYGRIGGEWTLFHIGDTVQLDFEEAFSDGFESGCYYKNKESWSWLMSCYTRLSRLLSTGTHESIVSL